MPLAGRAVRARVRCMKLNAALAKSLLMAASIGIVVPLVAQTSAKKEAPQTGSAQPPTTGASEEEQEPQLPGSVIARPGGGFLSLTVDGLHFKLSFYDAKKKPVEADAIRALARWDPPSRSQERSVLNPDSDGKALIGNVQVRPPYVFKVFLTLIGPDDKVLESHVVDFRG
jgi:hypothetical protein